MLRRDRDGRPWAAEGEMLTHFARVVKMILRAVGFCDELTFRSFRHGGATEAATSGPSDSQMRVKGQWTSSKVPKNCVQKERRYVHPCS
jgi:hypothetical protein